MRTEFNKLLKYLRKNQPNFDEALIRRAYRVANEAHKDQKRLSGEPYITHSLGVARILSQLKIDERTLAAAVLHDVLEDTPLTYQDLERQFGGEIAHLVEGVSKISGLQFSSPTMSRQEKQAQNLRKLLVATAEDIRVILIKLADRLHNIRTIEHLPEKKVLRICRETLDIYAPLAHRLGIEQWKWELEDHAFHRLYPEEYKKIARRVAMKRRERERFLAATIQYLEERLTEAEVDARVIGRPKHLYSIYEKMVRQGKTFEQVMDILALRIITQTVSGCYNALGVIHQIWTPVPGRFKDYVAMPKQNMYQSIHTTVMRETGMPMEVQIRTEEMDRVARDGIAAHWHYKEGLHDDKEDRLGWLRKMYDWLVDAHTPEELLDSVRRDVSLSDVYVFTPKGEVRELSRGATALDFAYHIHSEIGNNCVGAKVNGHIVPLQYQVQNGDVVEILTMKSQQPHLDWLQIVMTGKARTRIRQKLREIGELEPLDVRIEVEPGLPRQPSRPKPRPQHHIDEAKRHQLVRIAGNKGMEVQFAKCCNPVPGDPIVAYATLGTGMRIHRADCRVFSKSHRDPARVFPANWAGDDHMEIGMRVPLGQRPNALADVTNALRPMNISITRAQYEPDSDGMSRFDFVFETTSPELAGRVARTLETIAGLKEVAQLPPEYIYGANNGDPIGTVSTGKRIRAAG